MSSTRLTIKILEKLIYFRESVSELAFLFFLAFFGGLLNKTERLFHLKNLPRA